MQHYFIPALMQAPLPEGLRRLLTYADHQRVQSPLEERLLALCQAPADSGAALSYLGDYGQEPELPHVFYAHPVHLYADLQHILVTPVLDLSRLEAQAWAEYFNAHFQNHRLAAASQGHWYWLSPQPARCHFKAFRAVAGRRLILPQGQDELYWQSLLNEVQMLFFQSDLNRMREQNGQLTISGLWLSGGGCLPDQLCCPQADDLPLFKGICARAMRPCRIRITYDDRLEKALWRGEDLSFYLDQININPQQPFILHSDQDQWFWQPRMRWYFWHRLGKKLFSDRNQKKEN